MKGGGSPPNPSNQKFPGLGRETCRGVVQNSFCSAPIIQNFAVTCKSGTEKLPEKPCGFKNYFCKGAKAEESLHD